MVANSVGDIYEFVQYVLDFAPENIGYKQGFYRVLNMKANDFYRLCPWTFLNTKSTVTARGDYTTGTVTLTNGSRSVVGVGTTWDSTMDEAWIAPGTTPSAADFVRVGRVTGTTQLYLVEAYTGATVAGTAYTIRWRYNRLPLDLLDMQAMTARIVKYGELAFVSAAQERQSYLNEDITGTPICYTPANPEVWQRGQVTPPTPTNAPTVTYSATVSTLTTGTVYQYCYTWLMHGIETACSPIVEATPVPGTPSVVLSNFERVGATEGRTVRIYRAVKTEGIFKKIADVNATPYTDSGTAVDDTLVYTENNDTLWMRFYPRPGIGTSYSVELAYQLRPRLLQKDSDRIAGPPDACDAIVYATIAEMARKSSNGNAAAQYEQMASRAVDRCRRTYLNYKPDGVVRYGPVAPDTRVVRAILGTPRLT